MTNDAQIRAIAKLAEWKCPKGCIDGVHTCCPDCGGWDHSGCDRNGDFHNEHPCLHQPPYLESHDALIPVITAGYVDCKFDMDGRVFTQTALQLRGRVPCCSSHDAMRVLLAPVGCLAEALLKSAHAWVEDP